MFFVAGNLGGKRRWDGASEFYDPQVLIRDGGSALADHRIHFSLGTFVSAFLLQSGVPGKAALAATGQPNSGGNVPGSEA